MYFYVEKEPHGTFFDSADAGLLPSLRSTTDSTTHRRRQTESSCRPRRSGHPVAHGRQPHNRLLAQPADRLDPDKTWCPEAHQGIRDQTRLGKFRGLLCRGLEGLAATSPVHANPSLLPLEAIQLLSAAQSSWVFGGMGSWNDLGFEGEDQATYESLSEELYGTVNRAIVAATNASAVGGTRAPHPSPSGDKPGKRPCWKLLG